jgi:two-component system KDP operon response regulator KdpE
VSKAALELDPDRRLARAGEREALLNRREYAVLEQLSQAAGQTVPHARLLAAAWPPHTPLANLRVAILMLRRKLEADPELPTLIVTVPGVGYRLDLDA